MNYLQVTAEQLLEQFKARLDSDPRFKNIGSSSIYGMFQEMLLACVDMTHFYIQRTAEESFIETARLDSSVIKHGKNLGYNPRRAIPAECELIIRISGPLPSTVTAGAIVVFNKETMRFTYNGKPFLLDGNYSYTFSQEDILNGASSDWHKDLYFSVPAENVTYLPLAGINYYNTRNINPIKCFQGEEKIVTIYGSANIDKLGKPSQFYDIDDVEFSNWYGSRDPFALIKNVYIPERGVCQVGIGPDQDTAFNKSNLYNIETQSIYLNEDVIKLNGDLPTKPLKVCLLDTNSDKTVRLSFSSEKNICDIGLKSSKDNIYIKYIASKGHEANTAAIKGATMSFSNNINVHVNGSLVNITNNIKFIINSDITGGEDFESQDSIKINAPAYFSSRNKYITKNDFISYFRTLTSPLIVQNALVFGQQEIEDSTHQIHHLLQNNIIYCLLGHMYIKNEGNYIIRDVLTAPEELSTDTFTIYGDKYLEHLIDYTKMLISYNSFYNTQYNDNPSEQYLKNIKLIREHCKYNTEINSILLSLPPYIHYYDLVGKVYVKPMTDIEKYDTEIKNKIYQYLDENAVKTRKIYKSDIIRFYTDNDSTRSVDLDIKISSILKADDISYEWSHNVNNDFEIIQNKQLQSYTDAFESVGGIEKQFIEKYGNGWWNVIKIPKLDNYANIVTEKLFADKNINIILTCYDASFGSADKTDFYNEDAENCAWEYNIMCDITQDDTYIYLSAKTIQPQYYKKSNTIKNDGSNIPRSLYPCRYDSKIFKNTYVSNEFANDNGIISLVINVPANSDFSSSSQFSISRTNDYKISGNDISTVEKLLNDWLNSLSITKTANKAIPLPYRLKTANTVTREETFLRRGNLIGSDETTLSEYSFWNYFIPLVIHTIYNGENGRPLINENSNINGEAWNAASELILDLYKIVAPAIADSILDEHNNITNFSTNMETAVLRNKISIVYET